ncbi:MAG: DUF167 domain-containing protein [Eggerthellales bacterium]|mgnify:CR=1 FL=1|nr:DUF167 domain-containing protein [Eggerthellales bacterium]
MAQLACKVTPRSGKDQVMGVQVASDGSREVALRVTAPPDKGKANKAVCKLIASELGVPKSGVEVKRGDTSHHKILQIACDQGVVDAWMQSLEVLA